MPTPQSAILNRNMGEHQWYVHLSRVDGADLKVIKSVVRVLPVTLLDIPDYGAKTAAAPGAHPTSAPEPLELTFFTDSQKGEGYV